MNTYTLRVAYTKPDTYIGEVVNNKTGKVTSTRIPRNEHFAALEDARKLLYIMRGIGDQTGVETKSHMEILADALLSIYEHDSGEDAETMIVRIKEKAHAALVATGRTKC